MIESGSGDAGALARGLHREVTGLGLRALASKALNVAALTPERLPDVYDNAAAGWLGLPVFPPKLRFRDELRLSPAFWETLWELVALPADVRDQVFPTRVLELAGELDPGINARMAEVASTYPGVAEAEARGLPAPYDLDALAVYRPGSLGYAFRQELLRGNGVAAPFSESLLPLIRHMPPPLAAINSHVIRSWRLWALVAGHGGDSRADVAMSAFLMGQVGHHYSALAVAITLVIQSLERPADLGLTLDCIFRGWMHGRETRPLIAVSWNPLLDLGLDEVREALGVVAFQPPLLSVAPRRRD